MKNKIIALLILCVAGLAFAQSPSVGKSASREHRGFYSNMSFAFAYNWYENSRVDLGRSGENGKKRLLDIYKFDGFTFPFSEFKFGVGIGNLVAVHFLFNIGFFAGSLDYNYEVYNSQCPIGTECPETFDESRYIDEKENDAYGLRMFFGFGTTFYPIQSKTSPLNGLFIGGSVGYTLFVTLFDSEHEDATGNGGFGFQLEIGKEWWVNDHMSIGFGFGFAHSGLTWETVDSHSSDNVLSLSFRLTRG